MNSVTRDGHAQTLPERLPTMPNAAVRVLELAERGNPAGLDLYRSVRADPASVLALLAAAGRGRRRPDCPSLRIAIDRLGVVAALRICLEFRLPDRCMATERDCFRQWRSAVLITAYARAIARRLRRQDADRIETAAVLTCAPALRSAHRQDDAATWLACQGVDDALCALMCASRADPPSEAAACIALAARMSEVWLHPDWERNLVGTQALAGRLFGSVPDLCSWVFGVLGPQAHDLEMLLQIRRLSRRRSAALSARAHALLRGAHRRTGAPAD